MRENLKIGAMNNPAKSLLKEIQWIGENKFDFVDLTLEPPGAYAVGIDIDAIRELFDKYNLDAVGHTAYYLPFASPFQSFYELALRELRNCFEAFQALDIQKVNVHADEFSSSMLGRDRAITRNIKAMKSACLEAKRYGIELMIENTPALFGSVDELGMLFDEVPDMKFHLDVGHANLYAEKNKTDELLHRFHDRLRHVHLSDNKGGTSDLHIPLGAGLIPWDKVIASIKKHGYDGTMTLEVFSRDKRYLLASREKLIELWGDNS